MDTYLNKIKNSRSIRDTSINLYKSYMNRLNDEFNKGKEFNMNFIKHNIKEIFKYIDENFGNSVQRNFYASLLVFISPTEKNKPTDGFENIYDEILNKLRDKHNIYIDNKKDNKKNDKEDKNWISFEEVLNKWNKIDRIIRNTQFDDNLTKKDYNNLIEWVLLSLYTMNPPRRNDYAEMKIIPYNEYQETSLNNIENNNYLVKGKSNFVFSFGKNSVKSDIGDTKIIDVPKNLAKVLRVWLKLNKTEFLLPKYGKKEPITKNGLTLILNKIFYPKKISTSMLRKIYLSYKFGDVKKEQQKIAEEMNHSVQVQNDIYIKE